MKPTTELAHRRHAMVSTLRLWSVFVACAGVVALTIAALQRIGDAPLPTLLAHAANGPGTSSASAAIPEGPRVPRTAFAPTFDDAAASLRAGRHAEAYGRFVTLADEGDVDAARIALLMHRFGPSVFGSHWDASPEQLAEWTRWSVRAAERELAQLRADVAVH